MHLQGERGEEESEPGSQAGKALLQEERRWLALERNQCSLYSQPFLLLINGKLCPEAGASVYL